MTTAFVLSGGGSLGAVQVGMLQALDERNIRPELLIGTSAGAVNAAFIAGHGTEKDELEKLAGIWTGLKRNAVFPFEPLRHLLAVSGNRSSLCSNKGFRRLIELGLNFTNLEEAKIPVHIVATNLLSGQEVLMSSGDAVSALLASAAMPGVLPSIEREGLTLVDGGVADNSAISQALALGADEVYVLPGGFACALQEPPTGALSIAMQALSFLIEQRLIMEISQIEDGVKLRVLPPLCPLSISPVDFSHAGELIERARVFTGKWIDEGGPELLAPQRFMSLHNEGRPTVRNSRHVRGLKQSSHPSKEAGHSGG